MTAGPRRSRLPLLLFVTAMSTVSVTVATVRYLHSVDAGPPPAASAPAATPADRAGLGPTATTPSGSAISGRSAPALPAAGPVDVICGLRLPVDPQAGPYIRREGRASGFAHTPAGAVLAALHLTVRVTGQVGPAVFGPTLREQVTGPDLVVFNDNVHAAYERARGDAGAAPGQPLCPIYATWRGYRIDSYTPAAASVRLLFETPGLDRRPLLGSALLQVSWIRGDWRLVAPPAGDWATVRSQVPAAAAADYTPFPVR